MCIIVMPDGQTLLESTPIINEMLSCVVFASNTDLLNTQPGVCLDKDCQSAALTSAAFSSFAVNHFTDPAHLLISLPTIFGNPNLLALIKLASQSSQPSPRHAAILRSPKDAVAIPFSIQVLSTLGKRNTQGSGSSKVKDSQKVYLSQQDGLEQFAGLNVWCAIFRHWHG